MLSVFNDQEKPSLIDITHPLTENGKWELDFCLSPYISELTTELSEKKKKRDNTYFIKFFAFLEGSKKFALFPKNVNVSFSLQHLVNFIFNLKWKKAIK